MKRIIALLLFTVMMLCGCTAGDEGQSESRSAAESEGNTDTVNAKGDNLQESRQLFAEEYEILDAFDVEEEQKLAVILGAHYLNMQDRIDLTEIANAAPALGELLKQNEDELIMNFLFCKDYALLAVEEPVLEGDSLTFNAVISMSYNQNESLPSFVQLHYSWTGKRWICETVTEADPVASQKPNYFLVVSDKREESEKIFGTGNLLALFTFNGKDYRTEYEEKYLTQEIKPEENRDINQEITITDDGFFNVTPNQLKQNINNIASVELITTDYTEVDQGFGPIYEFAVGQTLRVSLFEDLEYGVHTVAVVQLTSDNEAAKTEEQMLYELIFHVTKACVPDKEQRAYEAAVSLMEKVINEEVENESFIELGALNVQASIQDGVRAFYLFSVPVGERPSV